MNMDEMAEAASGGEKDFTAGLGRDSTSRGLAFPFLGRGRRTGRFQMGIRASILCASGNHTGGGSASK
jgi:hypothetical protein